MEPQKDKTYIKLSEQANFRHGCASFVSLTAKFYARRFVGNLRSMSTGLNQKPPYIRDTFITR